MIKSLWYLFSFLTVLLIIINNPNVNTSSNFMSQSKFLNFRSDQLFLQKIIVFCMCTFFLLTILSLSHK